MHDTRTHTYDTSALRESTNTMRHLNLQKKKMFYLKTRNAVTSGTSLKMRPRASYEVSDVIYFIFFVVLNVLNRI